MKKVITYGTFDLLHYGHINLLKRAKALGDYLIVGVTTDSYDISRGKLNVQQSLMERIQAVKDTGLADEIIPEEYTGQKIDDIRKYDVDIFAIGSDWIGKFDYLKEYCEVVYLERTANISSSKLRLENNGIRLGIIGFEPMVEKFIEETRYVGNIKLSGIFFEDEASEKMYDSADVKKFAGLSSLLEASDAVYVVASPKSRAYFCRCALEKGKHVLCESPVALSQKEAQDLLRLAEEKDCTFFEAVKTAYLMAFQRLVLLAKSGEVGNIKAIDVTCTQLNVPQKLYDEHGYGSMTVWGPFGFLPVLQVLGREYISYNMVTYRTEENEDLFTRTDLIYKNAVASVKTGTGVKSEGELVITGTKGYIYVPSPWWKTEYFEVRYEDFTRNRRYFYKMEGEGIRYEIAAFSRAVKNKSANFCIDNCITEEICRLMEQFYAEKNDSHKYIL